MGGVKRRMLAYLLAMAMVLSLCTGITARAEGKGKAGGVIRIYGILDPEGNPEVPTEAGQLFDSDYMEAKKGKVIYFGLINGEKIEKLTIADFKQNISIKKKQGEEEVDVTGTVARMEPFWEYDQESKDWKQKDRGIFNVTFDEPGDYRVYYGESYVTFTVVVPEIGIYSSSDYSIENLVSGGDDVSFSAGLTNKYYIHAYTDNPVDVSNSKVTVELDGINEQDIEITDGADHITKIISIKTWVNWAFSLNITVKWSNNHETSRIFQFVPDFEGFVISDVDWDNNNSFMPDVNQFRNGWGGAIYDDKWCSLGIKDGDKVAPITDINMFSFYKLVEDEKVDAKDLVTITNKDENGNPFDEGVYLLNFKELGEYKIVYTDGGDEQEVNFSCTLPDVGIYNAPDATVKNMVASSYGDIEYSAGDQYYIVFRSDLIGDQSFDKADITFIKELGKESITWEKDEPNFISFTIPEGFDGDYDKAICVNMYYDGSEDPDYHEYHLREKKEGLLVAWAHNPQGKWKFETNIDEYSKSTHPEIMGDMWLCLGTPGTEGKVNPVKADVKDFKIYNEKGEPVDSSVAEIFDGNKYTDPADPNKVPDGIYIFRAYKCGSYKLEYTDTQGNKSSVRLICELPEIAVYDSAEAPSEATLFLRDNEEKTYDASKANEFYIQQLFDTGDWYDVENISIKSTDFDVTDYKFDKDTFDKNTRLLYTLKIPAKQKTEINIKVKADFKDKNNGNTWSHEVNFCFLPSASGFAISYAKGDQFNDDPNEYEARAMEELRVINWISLGIIEDSKVTAVTSDKLKDIKLQKEVGENYVDVSASEAYLKAPQGAADGVYNLWFKNPGNYRLTYNNEVVYLNVFYPYVAFCADAGAIDPKTQDVDKRLLDDIYRDSMINKDEKEFFINAYSPSDSDIDFDQKAIIKDIYLVDDKGQKIDDNTMASDYKGITLSVDSETTASVKVDSSFVEMHDDKFNVGLSAQVNYEVYDMHKEGGAWVVDDNPRNMSRWFAINIEDNREIINFTGAAWNYNDSFDYTGEEQTVEIEKLPEQVEVEYTNNSAKTIGDYKAEAAVTVKESEKDGYRMRTVPDWIKSLEWKIVKPASVIAVENDINDILPNNYEDLTTEDGDEVAAVNIILEKYNKLNDAQKAIVNNGDKLKKAVAALDNYEDAIAKINALPDEEDVKTTDEAAIKAARAAYDKLTDAQKAVVGEDLEEKLEEAETGLAEAKKKAEEEAKKQKEAADKKAADDVVSKISKLPSMAGLSDEAAVKAARAAYNALTADQKKLVDSSILKKLENAEASIEKAKKSPDDDKKKPKYSNEWINGKWYNEDGTQTYPGTLQWKGNATGWWVEDTDGWYPTDKWQKIDGVWYYFKPDGYMAANEYYKGYWFNADGSWDDKYFLSWKSNATGWWVEDISGWWPSSSWLKIDGYWYYFDASGYMVTSQYVDGYWISADGVCY